MSKVKLTQEQADAIEYGKHHHSRRKLIDAYTRKKGAFVDELDVLYELDYDDFFKALYIGYEVKPEVVEAPESLKALEIESND